MKTKASPVLDRYMELVRQFPLRPLRSDDAHARAVDLLVQLDGKPNPSDDENDYARTLALLIADYERPRVQRQTVSVAERIKHLMTEHGMTGVALGEVIGSRTAVSMILNGQRRPSKAHVCRLAAHFGLGEGYFMEREA